MIGIGAEKAIVFGVYNQTYKHTKNDFISGLNAGLFASLIVTPIEKYKILKQNDPKLTYTGITKTIFKDGQIRGVGQLYNGLSACFFREIPGYAVYFKTYNYLNSITKNDNDLVKTLMNGGLSGVSAWLVIYPFDTIKTNMHRMIANFETTKELIKSAVFIWHIMSLAGAFTLHSWVFIGYELSKRHLF